MNCSGTAPITRISQILSAGLDEKGKLQGFNEAYKEISGNDWPDDRDAFYLNTDSIKSALSRVLEQSEAAFEKWLDDPESVFHLSPENFAEWVKEYLDRKGPDHRIVFLVDEIGQFIGDEALDYLVRNTFHQAELSQKDFIRSTGGNTRDLDRTRYCGPTA